MINKRVVFILSTLLVFVVLSGCSYIGVDYEDDFYTGTVECDEVNISAERGGIIKDIFVNEGYSIKRDDKIAQIDVKELEIEKQKLVAGVDIAQSNLEKLKTGSRIEEINSAKANVEQLEAILQGKEEEYNYKLKKYNDIKKLYEDEAVSKDKLDEIESSFNISKSTLESTRQQYEAAREQYKLLLKGSRKEDVKVALARLDQAKASLELLNYNLSKEYIKAPFDGVIDVVNYDKGEYIPTYGIIANILDLDSLWVKIYVPEKNLYKVSLGEEVKIYADFVNDKSINGKVVYISNEAEFTPKNVESKENKQEMVFEVRVEIIDKNKLLKPGMLVDIDLGGEK